MPLERRATVIDSFSNAPEQIKEVVNKYDKSLKNVGYTNDEDGSYYSGEDGIMMKEEISDDEYGETFRHEYGHYIDNKLGVLSKNASDDFLFQQTYQIEKEHLYDNLGSISQIYCPHCQKMILILSAFILKILVVFSVTMMNIGRGEKMPAEVKHLQIFLQYMQKTILMSLHLLKNGFLSCHGNLKIVLRR